MEFARIFSVVFLMVAKISFFVLEFKLNWSPHIVDRDKDFGGLLNHAFINSSFYKDETQILCFSQDQNRGYCVLASKKC